MRQSCSSGGFVMRLAISLCYHRATIMVQVHSVPHSLYGGKPAIFSKIGRNVHGYTERCSCRCRARSSRPLPSASRRRAGSNRLGAPHGEWNLLHELFGETPNGTTGTVALPSPTALFRLRRTGGRLTGRILHQSASTKSPLK